VLVFEFGVGFGDHCLSLLLADVLASFRQHHGFGARLVRYTLRSQQPQSSKVDLYRIGTGTKFQSDSKTISDAD
jgi:hypothetical protein